MSISGTITYEASGFKLVGNWDGRFRIEWADPKPSDDIRREVDDALMLRLTRDQMVPTEQGMAELAMLVRQVLAAAEDGAPS